MKRYFIFLSCVLAILFLGACDDEKTSDKTTSSEELHKELIDFITEEGDNQNPVNQEEDDNKTEEDDNKTPVNQEEDSNKTEEDDNEKPVNQEEDSNKTEEDEKQNDKKRKQSWWEQLFG